MSTVEGVERSRCVYSRGCGTYVIRYMGVDDKWCM